MAKKMRYYRTAALLGPKDQHVAFRAKPQPIKIPWQTVVGVVVVVGIGLWVWLGGAWYLGWGDLTVTGVTSIEVMHGMKQTSDLLGWHRFSLHPAAAQDVLVDALPEYKDIRVHCGIFPTKCEIVVTPRTPVLTWVTGSERYWVDDGWIFYQVQGDRPDLPVIYGPIPDATSGYSVTEIYDGVRALAALNIPADALDFVSQRGLVWTDPAGRRVALGVGETMAPRLQMYEVVVSHCEAKGIFPQAVDVRFPGGATYSMERIW
jgi:cell division protein FtsQ